MLCVSLGGACGQALPPPDANGITPPSIATSLPSQGDPAGVRRTLAAHGITYLFNYPNDVLSNLRGGLRRGTIDQGKLEAILRIDLEPLAGLQGLSFFANVLQIHNTGRLQRDYVGGINTISSIEATPATRLSELWLEQTLAGGAARLRAGQLLADAEFAFSDLSTLFLQSGWPTILAADLPSGGPSDPLATPGVRLRLDPTADMSLLVGVFNGDPAGPGPGDEQLRNRHGLDFRVGDPPFVMGEAQFRRNHGAGDAGLAGALKLGGWGHFGRFDDQRFGADGTLLASPASSGIPLQHRGDYGVYAVIEQQLYRPRGGDAQSGVSVFGRVSISPSDRNLVDGFADGGVVFAGMIPRRPDDSFGASISYVRFSDRVRAFDRDTIAFTGPSGPVRDYETHLGLTYAAQVIPGWTVQPDLQVIFHPGGGAGCDAIVAGVRSAWRY
jgi:porin